MVLYLNNDTGQIRENKIEDQNYRSKTYLHIKQIVSERNSGLPNAGFFRQNCEYRYRVLTCQPCHSHGQMT
jgi:hypothetical protein